jgi:hypothetical protein
MFVVAPPIVDGDDAQAIVLFDGVCNLCSRVVLFILDRDDARFGRGGETACRMATRDLQTRFLS